MKKLFPDHYSYKTADVQLKQHITSTLINLPADAEKVFSAILTVSSLVFEMQDEQYAENASDSLPDFITITLSSNTNSSKIAGLA